MATAPVVAVPAKTNSFESFLSKFGAFLEKLANVSVNLAEEAAPTIEPLLPPAAAAGFAKILAAAATQVAAADAKYAVIGASTVPYAVKVAEAVAVGGEGVLAIAAQEGFTIAAGELTTLFSAAGTIASNLNFTGITAAPVVPAATPAA